MSENTGPVPSQSRSLGLVGLDRAPANLLDRLDVAVAQVDLAGVVISANDSLAGVLGATSRGMGGLDLKALAWQSSITVAEGPGRSAGPIERLLAGEPVDGVFAVTGLDARRRELRIRAVPASPDSPAVLLVADVTEQLHRLQSQAHLRTR